MKMALRLVGMMWRYLAQAKRNHLDCVGMSFDVVYCSVLARSYQTAGILFPDCEIVGAATLNEINYGDLNGSALRQFSQDKFECIELAFVNGECCLEVEMRMRGGYVGDMCFKTASPMATSVPLRPQDKNSLMPSCWLLGCVTMFASEVRLSVL